jgi:hypothetical protein
VQRRNLPDGDEENRLPFNMNEVVYVVKKEIPIIGFLDRSLYRALVKTMVLCWGGICEINRN